MVSRKLAVIEEETARKATALHDIGEGSVVHGIVKNLTDYGAFIDLGGIDGLLHVTDMSYGRIQHPSEILHVGDEISVNKRQADHLALAQRSLDAISDFEDFLIIAEQLRMARGALDALTGRASTEDMLDSLFGKFCIGK